MCFAAAGGKDAGTSANDRPPASFGSQRGFACLKLKVGALPFEEEIHLLREAHAAFPQAEIRVDANGAFSPAEAFNKLEALAAIVSRIEDPGADHLFDGFPKGLRLVLLIVPAAACIGLGIWAFLSK